MKTIPEKVQILISCSLNPYLNLASEKRIFQDMDTDKHILFLWQNSDTVVIGRNQNPWKECCLSKMEENNVFLARRESGGGAVFQDKGNLNFTFLSGINNYSVEKNFSIIISALDSLGLRAEVSGRNDITANGKKISGSAFRITQDRAFHHGTLLIKADMEKLSRYLSPPALKLKAKGISSVRSRVANIADFISDIDSEVISKAITNSFFKAYGIQVSDIDSGNYVIHLFEDKLKSLGNTNMYYEKLKSHTWLYGCNTVDFDVSIENRFTWGYIEMNFAVKNNIVKNAVMYTDALDETLPDIITPLLEGTCFNGKAIAEAILNIKKSAESPQRSEVIQDIATWLSSL